MDARELRIGNWYMGASRNEPLKATASFIHHLSIGVTNGNPIPLTPEILEKAGFVTLSDTYSKRLYPCSYIEVHNTFNQIWIEAGGGYCIPIEHIKHLHQLQNLYFALTGEELEVNL